MAGRRRASGGSDPGTLAAILNLAGQRAHCHGQPHRRAAARAGGARRAVPSARPRRRSRYQRKNRRPAIRPSSRPSSRGGHNGCKSTRRCTARPSAEVRRARRPSRELASRELGRFFMSQLGRFFMSQSKTFFVEIYFVLSSNDSVAAREPPAPAQGPMQRPTGGHKAPTRRPVRPARAAVGDDTLAPEPEQVLPPTPCRLAPRLV